MLKYMECFEENGFRNTAMKAMKFWLRYIGNNAIKLTLPGSCVSTFELCELWKINGISIEK